MNKTRRWRKIITMMLTVVMLLQNAQSVMVFADVTNEQIEQRLAGEQPQVEQAQPEQSQPEQSQVETRASGEEYKAQAQESQEGWSEGGDTGNPDAADSTTMEGMASNANVTAAITQSVFQAEVSGTVCNFVQMTAQIINHDAENPATGVSIKALLHSSQLSYVNGYGTETAGAGAYVTDSNNTSDLPGGSANGYDQIIMWTDQTIAAGGMAVYQFAAQIIPATLDGVVNAWYVNGNSCGYTWQNTEILTPAQTPEVTPETAPEAVPETMPEVTPETMPEATPETTPEITPETAPEITETPEENRTPEVTEDSEENPTPEPTQEAEDKKAVAAKKKRQQRLLAQRNMEDRKFVQAAASGEGASHTKSKNIADNDITFSFEVNGEAYDALTDILDRNAAIDIKMTYVFKPENQPTETDCSGYYYDLPNLEHLKYDLPENGTIQGEDGPAGSWIRNGNRITFNYDSTYIKNHPEEGHGTFHIWSKIDKESVSKIDKFPVTLGGVTTYINLKNTPLTGNKTYSVDENGNLIFKIVLTASDADAKNVVVTDTLTGNLQFMGKEHFKVKDSHGQTISGWSVEIKNQIAIISGLEVKKDDPITIEYLVQPNTSGNSAEADTNTASWTWGEGTGDGQKSDTTGSIEIDLDNNKLTKSGTVNRNQNQIDYVVNINEFGLQLLPTPGGVITVTDTISDEWNQVGLEIIRSSIKLVDKAGVTIPRATIVYSPTKLTITVPDATAAVLTYTVQMSGIPDVTKGKIKNTVKIEGEEEKEVTTENEVVIVKASATYDGVAKTVKIKKFGKYLVSGEYPSLSGATFGLYQCIVGSAEGSLVDTQTTANGTLQFKNVATGTLYYIKEVTPPDGYQIDETPIYFVTYAKAAEKDTIQAKIEKDFPDLVGKILYKKDGLVLEIEDEPVPEPSSLTIEADKTVKGQQTVVGNDFSFNMKFVSYEPRGKFVKGNATERYNVQENALTYNDTKLNTGTKIQFKPITFGYEGVYTFEVKEIPTTPGKYFYDETVYEIKATATNTNGHLTVVKEVIPNTHNNNRITFNNIEKTTFTLQKNTGENVKKDVAFNFTLSSTDNDLDFTKVEYEDSDGIVKSFIPNKNSATLVLTVKKDTNTSGITFRNLPVGAKIRVEENSLQAGWYLSVNNPYSPAQEIILVSTASNNKVAVTNEYKEDGSVRFEVGKKFNDWRDGQNFTFKLQGLSMEGEADSRLDEIPMPEKAFVNITNNSPANGDIRTEQFGDISYTVNGEYYYLLSEDNIPNSENQNGIIYDSKVTYLKVEVTDGADGKKTVKLYTSGKTKKVQNDTYKTFTTKGVDGLIASAEFQNKYEASTLVRFKGTKLIAGRDIKDTDIFNFEVSGGNLESPLTVQNSGTDINFEPVTFTQDDLKGESQKEFVFKIKEIGTASNGITFDSDTYEVKVMVSKNENGTLSARVEGAEEIDGVYILPNKNGKDATFINTYGASTRVILTATKTIAQRSLKNGEFTFKISGESLGENGKEVTNNADGMIEFPIDYTLSSLDGEKEKTFTYRVEEVRGSLSNGVTYDETKYTVRVKVSDNGSGKLQAEVIEGAEKIEDNKYAISLPVGTDKKANFENAYDVGTTIQFAGRKVLNNKALKKDEFEFEISGPNIGNGAPVKVKNDQEGNIEFPEITYKLTDLQKHGNDYGSNSFVYKIKEVDSKQPGITYDKTEYTVTVMVTNSNTGTLTTTVKMGTAEIAPNQNADKKIYCLTGDKAIFTNEYGAKETSVSFTGIKELQNRALKENDFTFVISGTDGTVYSSEIKNDIAGNIKFNPITYKLTDLDRDNAGNYTKKEFNYIISEKTDTANPGVIYSTKLYYAKVTVTNEKGELVKKVEIGTKDVEGKINYSEIKADSDGNYWITPKGMATFTNTYHAETTVQFRGTKALVDALGKNKGVSGREFEFEISGPKLGENNTDGTNRVEVKANGTFEFPVISYDVTDLDYEDENYTSKSFTYTIREVIPKEEDGSDKNVKDGITYDTTSYKIVVTVTNDIQTGRLIPAVKLAEDSPEGQLIMADHNTYTLAAGKDKATFTNTYDAATEYPFKVVKRLAGREFKEGDNFRFELLKGRKYIQTIELKVGQDGTQIKTDADGQQYLEASFEPQKYDLNDVGKTYEYTIRELNPENAMEGITIDDDIYIVDVTITDNNDGTLTATAKRVFGDTEEQKTDFNEAVFINTYKAEGTAQIVAKKFLSPGDIGAEKFTFTLTQVDDKGNVVSGGISQTKQNEGNSIIFDPIKYHQKGEKDESGNIVQTTDVGKTFWYEVKETAGTDTKYTYDNKVYKVKVEISINPDDNRKLVATQTIYDVTGKEVSEIGANAEAIVFTNRYKATGSVSLTGKKVIEGAEKLKAGEFNFEVREGVGEDAKVVATGTNDEDGNIKFSEIKYAYNSETNDLGEHVYTVTEVQPKDGDEYVYDLTSRKIVVKVTDNKDNTLKAELLAVSEKNPEVKSDVTDKVINSFHNRKISVTIRKTDAKGARLAGAELILYKYEDEKRGDVVDTWETKEEADHTITGKLIAGKTYILEETKVPDGYVKANPIIFTVKNDDTRTIEVTSGQLDKDGNLVMVDQKTGVQILKVDSNGKGVRDALLAVYDGDRKIEEWISDGEPHAIEGLVAGHKYTLRELQAPAGYRKADNITFSLNEAGEIFVNNEKVTSVIMRDAMTKASILKTDESGKALSGATLVVKDSAGKELDKWTTDGKAHEITGLLTVGETYTLSEISAPSGYTVAPDQTFKMEDKDVIEVTMVDYQASGSGQITVTKKVTLLNGGSTEELIAADDTFYVNLFTDAAGKYPYKGAMPQAIHLVNASAGSVTFNDLAQGTYYVYETDANGNVVNLDQLSLHNGSQFMCIVDGGSNVVQLDLKAGPKEGFVNLENAFYELPDGYYYKGEININKQVLKGDSQTTTNDTFYAGVFTKDEQGIYNLYQVVELVQNDTVTLEVPLGGEDGTEPINYYILETDADGNILDLDVFEYEVTGEGTVTLSKENQTGNINLVNRIPEETDGKLRVQKTDGNGVGLAGASFRLTDSEGAVIEEWTSQASAHELELEPGTYTLTEIQAPTGYTGAGSLKITVDEDYNFSVSGEIEYSYRDSLLKIVNKVVPVTPQPGTSTPVSGGTGAVSYSSALSGKVAVKTGDTTPVGWFLGLFATAAMLAGAAVHLKRRKR